MYVHVSWKDEIADMGSGAGGAMGGKNESGGPWGKVRAAYFGIVAGTRWLILIAVVLAALLAGIFGGLWEAVVLALLGFGLAQLATRWHQIEAEERLRARELDAHERQRVRDAKSQEDQRAREVEAAQRQQRIVVYNTFANAIYDTILTPIQLTLPEGEPFKVDGKFLTDGIMGVSKGLTMWGSDAVVRYYAGFMQRVVSAHDEGRPSRIFDEFADLFLELRRDAGYDNEGVGRPELHRLFGMRVPPMPVAEESIATDTR